MLIDEFADILREAGIRHGAGVPCSYFTPLVNHMGADPSLDYVGAASEGEAVAIAAGMTAAGAPAFSLMQNSGLGNAVNPVTSLLHVYRIPVTLLVSHRGRPGEADAPQHALMGQITEQLAALCGLRTRPFSEAEFAAELDTSLREGVPSAFIFPKGSLKGGPKVSPPRISVRTGAASTGVAGAFEAKMAPADALRAMLPLLGGDPVGVGAVPAVVSTTGKTSRELYELDDTGHDRHNRFYMVGSMGCAAGFGLGVALAQPERPVIVLDGDGALLMKLGTLATIGGRAPENFHHVLLDNGAHDSTGGQATASPHVDFQAVAAACGYRAVGTVDDPEALREVLGSQLSTPGPTLLRVIVRAGARGELGRPGLTPAEIYARFSAFLRRSG